MHPSHTRLIIRVTGATAPICIPFYSVSRQFSLQHRGRAIDVLVEPVDEAWELWLCESGRRLTLGGTVPIDDAVAAWREGKDPVLLMVEHIRARVESGELDLGDS